MRFCSPSSRVKHSSLFQSRSTTILCIKRGNDVVMVGDGQVTLGSTVVKPNAKKVRRIGDTVVAGFAGSTADAIALFERLEMKLEEHPGQLMRACVELAKSIRTEKHYREATMIVGDCEAIFTLTGNGDVVEPNDGLIAIGSGSGFALAAAKALIQDEKTTIEEVAKKSMEIASSMCIYTNDTFVMESVSKKKEEEEGAKKEKD